MPPDYTFNRIMYTLCVSFIGIFVGIMFTDYIIRGGFAWGLIAPIFMLIIIAIRHFNLMVPK